MNGVVPAWKILELLETGKLKEDFDKSEDAVFNEANANGVAVPSVAEPPTTDENPQGREDFNSLLDAAVGEKKPSQ